MAVGGGTVYKSPNLMKILSNKNQGVNIVNTSYIKDTTDFINKTKDLDLPDDSILVTMDVSALYTNIPNDEGIEAVKNSLKESTSTSLLNVITT